MGERERRGGAEVGEALIGCKDVEGALNGAHADEGGDGGHEELGTGAGVAEAETLFSLLGVLGEEDMAQEDDLNEESNHVAEAKDASKQGRVAWLVHGKRGQSAEPRRLGKIVGFYV